MKKTCNESSKKQEALEIKNKSKTHFINQLILQKARATKSAKRYKNKRKEMRRTQFQFILNQIEVILN